MYTKEMLESMKKVEANRAANAVMEPRRLTAEEKDTLLKTYHPDYRQEEFDVLAVGPNTVSYTHLTLPTNSRV